MSDDDGCPVCTEPGVDADGSPHRTCPECYWILEGGPILGAITAEAQERFNGELRAAQHRYDAVAAARAAWDGTALDRELLAVVGHRVRHGPPDVGEVAEADEVGSPLGGVEPTSVGSDGPAPPPGTSPRPEVLDGPATLVAIDADGVELTDIVRSGPDVRPAGRPSRSPWSDLLPELPADPAAARFLLAGGVGYDSTDWRRIGQQLERAARSVEPAHPLVALRNERPSWRAAGALERHLRARFAGQLQPWPVGPVADAGLPIFGFDQRLTACRFVVEDGDELLLVGTVARSVAVWRIDGDPPVVVGQVAGARITELDLDPGSGRIASGTRDGPVHLFSLGRPSSGPGEVVVNHLSSVNGVRFLDGNLLSLGDDDGLVLTPLAGAARAALAEREELTWRGRGRLAVSPSGGLVATAGSDGVIRLRDSRTGHQALLRTMRTDVSALCFEQGSNRLIVAGSAGGLWVQVLPPLAAADPTAEPVETETEVLEATVGATALAARNDLGIVVGDEQGGVALWTPPADGGRRARTLGEGRGGAIRAVACTAAGDVMSCDANGVVRRWRAVGETERGSAEGPRDDGSH